MENTSTLTSVETITSSNLTSGYDVTWTKWALTLTLAVTALVTFWGNLLVIIAFCVDKRLHNTFNLFVLNLAVTDTLVGLLPIPFFAVDYFVGWWPFGEAVCGIWILLDWGMTFESIFTLCAIAADRLWAVRWSVHYRNHNTSKKNATVLAVVW